MKALYQSLLLTIGGLAVAGTALAQVPSGNDTSDTNGNTGVGTFALGGPAATNGGFYNTAIGVQALQNNTTGSSNAASGYLALNNNNTGSSNTASGYAALFKNTTGNNNTANGQGALANNTTGSSNTASGLGALGNNTIGSSNTASGYQALHNNTADDNTATGFQALELNTTGTLNNAVGWHALASNTTGSRNNAWGGNALQSNTTASDNNAMGTNTLTDNTTGSLNNAVGNFAMEFNTTGNNNNAVGYGALLHNTIGGDNNAQGYFALANNTTGDLNIGIGYQAGVNQTTGSQNIYIGHRGVAGENHVIRIGSTSTPSVQNTTYIAGIAGVNVTGAAVVVNSSGQLGVVSSSRRYKEDIAPLGDVSERLYQLRPVSFRYKKPDEHGRKPVQFGLVAEDVAAVFPELVVYGADGEPQTVAYQTLATLLLNELQKQRDAAKLQAARLDALESRVSEMAATPTRLKQVR